MGIVSITLSMALTACSEDEEILSAYEGALKNFENQNIPQELCGTWYEVGRNLSYYEYLNVNSDGTMEKYQGTFFNNNGTTEKYESTLSKGLCYYKNNVMKFYYDNGENEWHEIGGGAESIVEWTAQYMILGNGVARFLSRTKDPIPFVGKDRDKSLVATWSYNTEHNKFTLILNADGSGQKKHKHISSGAMSNYNITNWFSRNGWIYILIEDKKDVIYDLNRYALKGNSLYLYKCPVEYNSDEIVVYQKQ